MAQTREFALGTVPDMYRYNSDNCHYDLLVDDNSRLAVLGLMTMEEEHDLKVKHSEEKGESESVKLSESDIDSQWKTVNHQNKIKKHVVHVEKAQASSDSDEIVLMKHWQNGQKRASLQSVSQIQTRKTAIVNQGIICKVCSDTIDDLNTMDVHMKNYEGKKSVSLV